MCGVASRGMRLCAADDQSMECFLVSGALILFCEIPINRRLCGLDFVLGLHFQLGAF